MSKRLLSLILLGLGVIANLSAQKQTVGLFTQKAGSTDGYVLVSPINTTTTYLIDKCGKEIHSWTTNHQPGLATYLLPDGSLLCSGRLNTPEFPAATGSAGGILEKYNWDGKLTWSYQLYTSQMKQDHDIYPMSNGNILAIIYERHSSSDAIAAGRDLTLIANELWNVKIYEIQPVDSNDAKIVWQWSLWDHLIQDYDSGKANYGVVTDHPELMNINFSANGNNMDWIHSNSVIYNEKLDQILISCRNISELWVLDHSTTTAQAASHTGGNHNKGGDFLYRWGNPQSYDRGANTDEKLFVQHSASWIPDGYPDANKIMVFNDGTARPDGTYSSIDIINPPIDTLGNYDIKSNQSYGPSAASWSYTAELPSDFYSEFMGGAERLSNGNTIICESMSGNLFEIDADKSIVWRYVTPVGATGTVSQDSQTTTNQVYRIHLYTSDYGAFNNKTLTPGDPIERNPMAYDCSNLSGIAPQVDKNSGFTIVNPFSDRVVLSTNQDIKEANIALYDITGKEVMQWQNINFIKNQPLQLLAGQNMKEGLYLIKINNASISYSGKIVHE